MRGRGCAEAWAGAEVDAAGISDARGDAQMREGGTARMDECGRPEGRGGPGRARGRKKSQA